MADETPCVDRCSLCGYLVLRHSGTRELVEADEQYRKDGKVPGAPRTGGSGMTMIDEFIDSTPICSVWAKDLVKEMEDYDDWHTVVTTERKCKEATKWYRGFSPQQHLEMNMLLEQRKWQEEQARKDQKWREEQAEKAERRHNEAMKVNIRAYLVGGLFGLATALAAVALAKLLQ